MKVPIKYFWGAIKQASYSEIVTFSVNTSDQREKGWQREINWDKTASDLKHKKLKSIFDKNL